jgi:aminotransferase in exopolysaccharide biosynthesis
VGARVAEFEQSVARFCGLSAGVATVNGTAALHSALKVCGVERGDEVISQALTFVATANAITYTGASPVFIDVDKDTLGMSPDALAAWLEAYTDIEGGRCVNIKTRAKIAACVPMHTFGLPMRIGEVAQVCQRYGIPLIEDTAESLGSYVNDMHTGTLSDAATFSFNGNKIITTGGGGMIVTNNLALAAQAKHITTTAKKTHEFEFIHDQVGFNYRLPNLNAALGVAQMEALPMMLEIKKSLADEYKILCEEWGIAYIDGIVGTRPNYWLNALLLNNKSERDEFLKVTNASGVSTRPIWQLMVDLPMFQECQNDGLPVSRWLSERVVNIPSGVPETELHRLSL